MTERKASSQAAGFLFNKISLIVVAVLLIMAAWAGQAIIVILLGLALSAAGISRLWSHFCLKGVHCERQCDEKRVFPEEYLELKLRLVNRKWLPLPWIEVSDEVPVGFILGLKPGSRPGYELISQSTSMLWYSAITWKYRLLCKKRGYYPLGPLTVNSGDIFGFYRRSIVEPAKDHIIVYPKIYNLTQLAIPSLYPLGEAKSERRIFEDPSRTVGIRDYYPGDSLRRIHWKASARQQRLQVKVFEPSTTLKVAMFLAIDSFQINGIWNYDLVELGISTAASLANYMVDKNSQVGLWSNSKLAETNQPIYIPSGSGVDQLVQILEALAKSTSVYNNTFVEYFQGERKNLPMGTTLMLIFSQLPENLIKIIVDLRESGYKVLVFQIGEVKTEEYLPDIAWYNIRQPGEMMDIGKREGS